MAERGRRPWRSDEGGAIEGDLAWPTATLTRRAVRAGLSRQRERQRSSVLRCLDQKVLGELALHLPYSACHVQRQAQ